jgi:hypothetical protein
MTEVECSAKRGDVASLKFNEADYIAFDPCEGEDAVVSCRTVRLVRARKERPCFFGSGQRGDGHLIRRGEVYRSERALVDGDYWGNYAVCVPCMDKWLTDIGVWPRAREASPDSSAAGTNTGR